MPRLIALFLAAAFASQGLAIAQEKKDEPAQRTDAEILKTVKLPEGYAATVFASPPSLGYPTSISAAIDGTIFVAVDENGSIGRDRNAPGKPRGYVMRLRDTDSDGKADEFKKFAEMESPRGVIWDGPGFDRATGKMPGTLYVMYPPKLTAFHDTDGDGAADQQDDLLTGIGFGLDFRGADHTTNGCRLAIDGFIYIAVGDYGFTKAVAKDGTTLSMRGGGIVRIRPDGTGFEIVSRGQRNIYDVAVSPTLDLFTRDNTNDGGGWNVRLSHVPPGAHLGYPTLFINFPEDHLAPLADLGGGSPCGALWLDEPGLPRGLFTVEWGANAIMYHDDLVPAGAGWKLATQASGEATAPDGKKTPTVKQNRWLSLTRPTDMDVDASGALFITSWEGATFNYNGPFAGYVLRVVKKDAPRAGVLDLSRKKINGSEEEAAKELLKYVGSGSASLRLAAQRELIRRILANPGGLQGVRVDDALDLMEEKARAGEMGAAYAAYFVFAIGGRAEVKDFGGDVEKFKTWSPETRLLEVRVMGNGDLDLAQSSIQMLVAALSDSDARVRAAAITALRRLGKADAAASILPLVADPDPVIAHLAVRALSELKAAPVCLAALDVGLGSARAPRVGSGAPAGTPATPDANAFPTENGAARVGNESSAGAPKTTREARALPIAVGALQALYGICEPAVVDGLIARLPGSKGELRRGILNALCRLANVDAPYADPREWWGTRPDTSGPVYKPVPWAETEKIQAALKRELDAAQGEDARWLVQRMYLCKVNTPGLVEQMLAACGNDTPARLQAIAGLFRHDDSLPTEGVKALGEIAANDAEPPELRARALRLLQRGSSHGSVFATAVAAFAPLAGHDLGQPALAAAFEDFTRDGKNTKWIGELAKMALAGDGARISNASGPQSSRVQEPAAGTAAGRTESNSVLQQRSLAQTILVNLATSALVKGKDKENAEKAVEKSWEKSETAASLLAVIARTKAKAYAAQVDVRLKDANNTVAEAALFAHQALGLGGSGAPQKQIGEMKYEMIFSLVQKGGDPAQGKDIYLRSGCIACHTIDANEPPKGPILSAVAKMYDRAALTESILKPNAKLAQGFESTWIKTKKGEQLEGFVTREGGDNLDLRNVAGQTVLVEKADIAERGHREQSMMPEGLMNAFTPTELASLLAYLESLKK